MEQMVHEIAGYTLYLNNIVCIPPFRTAGDEWTLFSIYTTGGEIELRIRTKDAEAAVAELRDAMSLLISD